MTPHPVGIPDKMLAIHHSLATAAIARAFGGALALAWCTQAARGTIDVDLNVFAPSERSGEVVAALPAEVAAADGDLHLLERDGQARLWWDTTPVDVFLSTSEFHDRVAERVRWEPFAGEQLPFLACQDLAVFKAFFDRTKDWADLEAMQAAGTLDVPTVVGVLATFLGADDQRVGRLLALI